MSWIKLSCNAPGLSKQKYEPKNHKFNIIFILSYNECNQINIYQIQLNTSKIML